MKRPLQSSFFLSLDAVLQEDSWHCSAGVAAARSMDSLLLTNKDLVKSQAALAGARLSLAAFIPNEWEDMSAGEIFDATKEIISQTTTLDNVFVIKLSQRVLKLLISSKKDRDVSSNSKLRSILSYKSGRRCHICGRKFSKEEMNCFELGKPRSAKHQVKLIDKFKPIYLMKDGWTIDIEHVDPVSQSGGNDEKNLALACRYCNSIKKELTSIIDARMLGIYKSTSDIWKFHALKLISNGSCYKCGLTVKDTELTVSLIHPKAMYTLENFYVTCYEHDLEKCRYVKSK